MYKKQNTYILFNFKILPKNTTYKEANNTDQHRWAEHPWSQRI